MGASGPVVIVQGATSGSAPDDTPTVIATLGGVFCNEQLAEVLIEALVEVSYDADASAANIKLFRGVDATGTLVGTFTVPPLLVAAANVVPTPILAVDRPGIVADQPYCLILTATGATDTSGATTVCFAATTTP